jgi:hypothetical protein
MSEGYWFGLDGNPIDVYEADRLMADTDTRTVAKTRFVDNDGDPFVEVSTVFLVHDHDFGQTGVPVLWETMVFGGPLDQEMMRYSSRAGALQGHRGMCAVVGAALQANGLPYRVEGDLV